MNACERLAAHGLFNESESIYARSCSDCTVWRGDMRDILRPFGSRAVLEDAGVVAVLFRARSVLCSATRLSLVVLID
jgi:hypothetical protein